MIIVTMLMTFTIICLRLCREAKNRCGAILDLIWPSLSPSTKSSSTKSSLSWMLEPEWICCLQSQASAQDLWPPSPDRTRHHHHDDCHLVLHYDEDCHLHPDKDHDAPTQRKSSRPSHFMLQTRPVSWCNPTSTTCSVISISIIIFTIMDYTSPWLYLSCRKGPLQLWQRRCCSIRCRRHLLPRKCKNPGLQLNYIEQHVTLYEWPSNMSENKFGLF